MRVNFSETLSTDAYVLKETEESLFKEIPHLWKHFHKIEVKLISFKNNPKSPSDTQNLQDSAPIFQASKHAQKCGGIAGQNLVNFVCQIAALLESNEL